MHWRVVLLKLPPEGRAPVEAALGRPLRKGDNEELPVLLGYFPDPSPAEALATRLRDAGAGVLVVDGRAAGAAFCKEHPLDLCHDHCRSCRAPICPQCRREAHNQRSCRRCARALAQRTRLRRLRSLFALFLFAVFLFEAYSYLQAEEEHLTPTIHVGVIQLVPKGLKGHPLIRTLNAEEEGAGTSLRAIGPWYNAEYTRYTGYSTPLMQVTLRGPFEIDLSLPDLGQPDDSLLLLAYKAWRYPRAFHEIARSLGVDPDDFGARLYVTYLPDTGDVASDSRGSRKGRVGISFISLQDPNPAYAALTVAHELGHVLGADDAYDDTTYLARFPEGYVEPHRTPAWPQRYAEVMAVDLPLSPTFEDEVRSLQRVKVGYASAAAMGWIPKEQADFFYTPPEVTPAERLEEEETSWSFSTPPHDTGASPAEASRLEASPADPSRSDGHTQSPPPGR